MSKYDSHLKCSFCGKSQEQVRKLIAGPGVYICDECVDLCNEILDEEDEDLARQNGHLEDGDLEWVNSIFNSLPSPTCYRQSSNQMKLKSITAKDALTRARTVQTPPQQPPSPPQREGQSGTATPSSIKELLAQYQDVLNPSGVLKQTTEDVAHHLQTRGPPIASKFRRM